MHKRKSKFWSKIERFMESRPMIAFDIFITIVLGYEATRIVWEQNVMLAIIVAIMFINDVLDTALEW